MDIINSADDDDGGTQVVILDDEVITVANRACSRWQQWIFRVEQ